jgi:hypothetical protein
MIVPRFFSAMLAELRKAVVKGSPSQQTIAVDNLGLYRLPFAAAAALANAASVPAGAPYSVSVALGRAASGDVGERGAPAIATT